MHLLVLINLHYFSESTSPSSHFATGIAKEIEAEMGINQRTANSSNLLNAIGETSRTITANTNIPNPKRTTNRSCSRSKAGICNPRSQRSIKMVLIHIQFCFSNLFFIKSFPIEIGNFFIPNYFIYHYLTWNFTFLSSASFL